LPIKLRSVKGLGDAIKHTDYWRSVCCNAPDNDEFLRNGYSLLAGVIRNLHDTVINENISTDDSSQFSARLPAFGEDCG
jgi:hypothetical protein